MIKAPLYKVKDSLSKYIEKASEDEVILNRRKQRKLREKSLTSLRYLRCIL